MDEEIFCPQLFGPSTKYFDIYEYYDTMKILMRKFRRIDSAAFIEFGKTYLPVTHYKYLIQMVLMNYLVMNESIPNIDDVLCEIFPLVLPISEILFAYLIPVNFAWSKLIAKFYVLDFERKFEITFRSIFDGQNICIHIIPLYQILKIIFDPENLRWAIREFSPARSVLEKLAQKYDGYIRDGDWEYLELRNVIGEFLA